MDAPHPLLEIIADMKARYEVDQKEFTRLQGERAKLIAEFECTLAETGHLATELRLLGGHEAAARLEAESRALWTR